MNENLPVTGGVTEGAKPEQELFAQETKLIQDYASGLTVDFEPGDGWAVNLETNTATYNAKDFDDPRYSQTMRLWMTLHEVDHVVEQAELLKSKGGQAIWQERLNQMQKHRRYQLLDNCVRDVADNRRVTRFAPALGGETQRWYQEIGWDQHDFTDKPRHVQFASAILREGMLTDETVVVSEDVREALEELQRVSGKSGKSHDVIAQITDPNCSLATKLKLMRKYVDPVYERLFEQDKEDNKKNKPDNNQSNQNQDSQSDTSDNDSEYEPDYDEIEQKMPTRFDEEKVEQIVTASLDNGAKDRQQAGYEAEHKILAKDMLDYRQEYQKITPYLEPVREQFRRIVAERLIPKRRLVGGRDEGVMVTPGLAAVAEVAFAKGMYDVPVYMDFEGRVIREEVPSAFEISGVFDRSGSMAYPAEKMIDQRLASILMMEALQEFMDQPEVQDRRLDPDMFASCEIRSFGGGKENVVIRPFAKELTEQQRIGVFKTLADCSGSSTEDYISLGQIIDEMKQRETGEPGYLEKVKTRKIKKIVAVFSDGGSSNQGLFDQRSRELAEMGAQVVQFRKIDGVASFVPKMADILKEGLDSLCYQKKGN